MNAGGAPAKDDQRGFRMFTSPRKPDAQPAADVVERGEGRRLGAGCGFAEHGVDPVAARRPAGGPRGRSSVPSPTSVSQQPMEPQRHGVRPG